ncbi:DNA repair protein RecO [soil metagenome]
MATSEKGAARPRVRAARSAGAAPVRVTDEPAFVLHSTPYRETSLVAQLLTRSHGRVAAVAKGAKRPNSPLRQVLTSLQPLRISYTGRGEVKTLTGAQWVGGQLPLRGGALLSGFYLNELMLRLLAREDPHEQLFDGYAETLARLGAGEPAERALRRFERLLLRETGSAMQFDVCADGTPVEPELRYVCIPEYGVRPSRAGSEQADSASLHGSTLIDLEAGQFADARTLSEAKQLLRGLLNHALAGRPIATRQLLIDLQAL